MNKEVMFSHKTDHWSTPKDILAKYKNCFDPCPLNANFDGLIIPWKKFNFVNPPYSNIAAFVDKALNEAKLGKTTYLLVPSRTDTKWFHRILNEANHNLFFYKGRLRFGDSKNAAPFPSVLITIYGDIK